MWQPVGKIAIKTRGINDQCNHPPPLKFTNENYPFSHTFVLKYLCFVKQPYTWYHISVQVYKFGISDPPLIYLLASVRALTATTCMSVGKSQWDKVGLHPPQLSREIDAPGDQYKKICSSDIVNTQNSCQTLFKGCWKYWGWKGFFPRVIEAYEQYK